MLKNHIYLNNLIFLKNLKTALNKKSILIDDAQVKKVGNSVHIVINSFFRHKKLIKYLKKVKNKRNKIETKKCTDFLLNNFKPFITNLIIIRIINLNTKIKQNYVKIFLKDFKKFKKNLFIRRMDLFSDFLKLTSLIVLAKSTPKAYLFLLAQIFTIILKQKHTQFLFFIKKLLKKIMELKNKKVKGLKFWISGKLKGKPRANTIKMLVGIVSCQRFKTKIKYNKLNTYNRYGAFGLKLWVTYV